MAATQITDTVRGDEGVVLVDPVRLAATALELGNDGAASGGREYFAREVPPLPPRRP
jgi:hypothetical protein